MSSPFQNLKHAIKMVNSVVHHVERTLFFFLRFTHLRYGYNKLLFKGIVNPFNPYPTVSGGSGSEPSASILWYSL